MSEPHIPITAATRPYPGITLFFYFYPPPPSRRPARTHARFCTSRPGEFKRRHVLKSAPGARHNAPLRLNLHLTLLEQFLPLVKSHRLSPGLCREDTDLVGSLARPVHIASGGRGASAWSRWTLRNERFAMRRCSSCSTSTNPCDCGQPNSGGPRPMQN